VSSACSKRAELEVVWSLVDDDTSGVDVVVDVATVEMEVSDGDTGAEVADTLAIGTPTFVNDGRIDIGVVVVVVATVVVDETDGTTRGAAPTFKSTSLSSLSDRYHIPAVIFT
jgi:hypothetical protein